MVNCLSIALIEVRHTRVKYRNPHKSRSAMCAHAGRSARGALSNLGATPLLGTAEEITTVGAFLTTRERACPGRQSERTTGPLLPLACFPPAHRPAIHRRRPGSCRASFPPPRVAYAPRGFIWILPEAEPKTQIGGTRDSEMGKGRQSREGRYTAGEGSCPLETWGTREDKA